MTKKLLLCFFIAALLPFNVASQTPSNGVAQGASEGQFTLKTTTEVVLVNVTVKDKDGKFIKDLKASDFSVLEDGKKQDVISVDAENTDSVVTSETPTAPLLGNLTTTGANKTAAAPAPAEPLQESDLKDRRLIVLFFDLGSMQPEEVERAGKSAADYVDTKMAAADLVSVVSLSNSLSVDQDFTSDKEQLKTVLAKFNTGANEGLGDAATADTTGDSTDTTTDAANGFTPDETEYNVFNTDRRLQALTSIATDLSKIQQRKSLIYFSGGIQRTGVENQTQLRVATNAAQKANLAFYPVDVRGLQAIIPGGSAGGGGRGGGGRGGGGSGNYSGASVLSAYNSNLQTQETLATLATDTGGKAFLDSNDFAPAFTKVQEDTSFYYLLGYISNNSLRDGRYRRITVRVNRSDLKDAKLSYRQGYYSPADFQHSTKETREQQLQDQLVSDIPSSDFPVFLSTGYFRLGDNRYFVPVSLVVPGSQIPFTRASDQDRATLDVIGIVRDEAKRPFNQLRDTVKLAVNTSQDVQRKNVQYDTGLFLPPGQYDLKLVVRENQTGRMATFEANVTVPDLKAAPVKVSSIILSNQKQPAKAKNNPLVYEGSEIVPNVTHVFSSGQHLYLYYEVYDPAKPADATDKTAARVLTNVAFYKGAVKAYETPLVKAEAVNVPERKATGFELDVPLADLKPGFYTCQVNVIDDASGKFAFPRVAFMVR
jgi:VWFA-related protein